MEEESKMVAYYILNHKYLEMFDIADSAFEQIIEKNDDIYPEDWHLEYSIDAKIKYLGQAIREHKKLPQVIENE